MGCFIVQIDGRRFVLPNAFYAEAANTLFQRAFGGMPEGPLQFEIGLGSYNTSGEGGAKSDGDADDVWRGTAGYDRRETTMTVAREGGTVTIKSILAGWSNSIRWEPHRYDIEGQPGYWLTNGSPGSMLHGWPWDVPATQPGIVGSAIHGTGRVIDDPGESSDPLAWYWTIQDTSKSWTTNQWSGYRCYAKQNSVEVYGNDANKLKLKGRHMMPGDWYQPLGVPGETIEYYLRKPSAAADAWDDDMVKAESASITRIFLAIKGTIHQQVASAEFKEPVILRCMHVAQDDFYDCGIVAQYVGQFLHSSQTNKLTAYFTKALADRMFGAWIEWELFYIGLYTNTPDLIDIATVSDVVELDAPSYARKSAAWSVHTSGTGPTARLTCGAQWHNTSDNDWPAAKGAFVVGTIGGVELLIGVWPFSTPEVIHQNEFRGLPNNRLELQWLGLS